MNIDDYPRDHVHCNTAGEALVNGVAISDFDHCEHCEGLLMAGEECDCTADEKRTRWFGYAGVVLIVVVVAVIWRAGF